MNVKIPTGMKSPTVIIVGQNQPDEKKNDMHAKRMDNLENKLDQQYKAFSDKKEYVRLIEQLNKSFMGRLDSLVKSNKDLFTEFNKNRINDLRVELNQKIKDLNKENSSDELLKIFAKKLGGLQKSVEEISQRPVTVKVQRTGNGLNSAFEKMYLRLEAAIKSARPRMIPSPS